MGSIYGTTYQYSRKSAENPFPTIQHPGLATSLLHSWLKYNSRHVNSVHKKSPAASLLATDMFFVGLFYGRVMWGRNVTGLFVDE